MGAREIAHGLAILSRPRWSGPVWSRVAGDALDLTLLGSAFRGQPATRRTALAAATLVGVGVVDTLAARRLSQEQRHGDFARDRLRILQSTTVNRPIEQVYAFWRDFRNMPKFMRYIEEVKVLDSSRSEWLASGPGGLAFSWTAEVTDEREAELISWHSLPGSSIDNLGTVRFQAAPGARGTEVTLDIEYRAPAGALGRRIAWLFGKEPEQQMREDLRRFKQLMEAGEIAVSEGTGLWRPARPVTNPDPLRASEEVK
jgi:uncharacterized membrane protein